METLSSVQCLGGDVELAVGLSTIQCSRVFEVVNKIQIHAPLELSVLRTATPLELSPHQSAPRVPHSAPHVPCSSQSFSLWLYCGEPATLRSPHYHLPSVVRSRVLAPLRPSMFLTA